MNLHSGYPFWLIRNGLLADFPALETDLPDEEIIIIGSGISGALAAHELCTAGFRCTIIDKRLFSAGSSWASTAQLNYEIDVTMTELAKMYDEAYAVAVYQASLQAVEKVAQLTAKLGLHDVAQRSSIYLASNPKGAREIAAEYDMRSKHQIPVSVMDANGLRQFGILQHDSALYHRHAFEFDAYQLSAGIVQELIGAGNLKVFTRTCIEKMQPDEHGVTLLTDKGLRIRSRYVVCAPGYESAQFLPKKVMKLHATYALVTQPLPETALWKERSLIWETKRPYFYCRTTADNRIMMGGGDVNFSDERRRDALMSRKKNALLARCNKLFPHLNLQADFVWCGTFGETEDGLPFVGRHPGINNVFFALGYGGNGTSYSAMAAEIICNDLRGVQDERASLFRFDRK